MAKLILFANLYTAGWVHVIKINARLLLKGGDSIEN